MAADLAGTSVAGLNAQLRDDAPSVDRDDEKTALDGAEEFTHLLAHHADGMIQRAGLAMHDWLCLHRQRRECRVPRVCAQLVRQPPAGDR